MGVSVRLSRTAAVLAVAGLLAACGGTSSSAPPGTAQVAQQIGATNLRAYSDHGPFARAQATARWHGRNVMIAVFANDTTKQAYIKLASAFDGPPLTSGPGWVVFPN